MVGPRAGLLSHEAVVQLVGAEAYARALVLTRSGHVHGVELDEDTLVITGRVKGTYRDDYAVSVHLATSRSGATTIHRSRCSCPVATDCKHVAAVLIVARHTEAAATQRLDRPEWEKALDKLLAAPVQAPAGESAPLGLEFGVEKIPAHRGYAGRQELRIRPVRPGKSGWVRSGISWDDLDFVARSYRSEHRELLLQFRAAVGASARYALPRSGWLPLTTVTAAFWALLEQTTTVGLTLVAAKPLLGPIRSPSPATVVLDAHRAGAAGLLIGPQVLLDQQRLPLASVGVLGEPAHGVFHVTHETPGVDQLVVARLDQLLSRELRQLVVDAHSLIVPAADEPRFLADYVPGLRQQLTLTSADGSVRFPDAARPSLGLTVTFRSEHRVRLDWSVRYETAEGVSEFAVDAPAAGSQGRDTGNEQQLLAAVPLPYDQIPQLADRPRHPDSPAAHVLLEGLAAVTFVEHALPLVEKHGVLVVLAGEVLDYRESGAEPAIAVSAVERVDSADWFDLHVDVSVEGEQVPFDQLFVALTRGEDYVILDTGVYFALERPQFDQLRTLISESKSLQDRDAPTLQINRFSASLWSELVDLGVVVQQSTRWARTVQGLNDLNAVEPVEVPNTLDAELRPYQRDGFRWLHFLYSAGLGGILADDMGLGKTLQTLALICRVKLDHPDRPPFLVVAPTSVVSGWASEAAKFAPGLRTVAISAGRGKRRRPLVEQVAGADVVVTSYALLRVDNDAYVELPWAGLILDEAQFVKNYRAKTYQCARRVAAPFTLAITGTPLENSLMDLWALLSIAAPGLFPSPERFSEFYRRPIERTGDRRLLAQLRRRIAPVLLRRTKLAVAAELPPKQEQVVEVELDPRHMRIYQTHLQRERQKVLGLIDDLDRNRFTILRSLTLLRRLSLDPALLDGAHAGVPAAKVDVLLGDLAEIVAEGHQALVFSQFTSFLGRIRERLDAAGLSYAYLDGATRDRDRAVQSFRAGAASVFLISLKAGGFGLNLTEADYCFVLDPWWNPAAEAQAVDRTHRIGQDKTVMVYRMVAKDTIEEKVMDLKARKAALFDSVFAEDALGGVQLSAEEIRHLLMV